MKIPKGSFEISQSQDIPLLQQVLDCQFVTHSQLWQFLNRRRAEFSRRSFCWRVKRLVDGQFLRRGIFPMVDREFVYSVATAGVSCLQNHGVFYSGPAEGPRLKPDGCGVAHAIGLNRIRLQLTEQQCLVLWQPEVEIRSQNELTKQPYQKDYDAIVTLRVGDKVATLGLEYERTPKAWAAYMEIRKALEKETRLDKILYVTANSHIQQFLRQCFWQTKQRVFICLENDMLHRAPDELDVIDASSTRPGRLSEFL